MFNDTFLKGVLRQTNGPYSGLVHATSWPFTTGIPKDPREVRCIDAYPNARVGGTS